MSIDSVLRPVPRNESSPPQLISSLIALAVVAASLAIVVHTAWVVASLATPVPWGDINSEHVWISQHGVHAADLFRPHNEHIILFPRLFFLVDFYVFGASNNFLAVCNFAFALGIALVFYRVAAKWFFSRRLDAALYACVLLASYVNCLQLFNLVCGLMLTHWLANFLVLVFALLFARQFAPQSPGAARWRMLALVPLGFAAVFTSGSGMLCLATAVFLAVVFGLGGRKTVFFAALLALLALVYFLCNSSNTSANPGGISLSGVWNRPADVLRCYFAFLGGPGSRYHLWPADVQTWLFHSNRVVLRGALLFALGVVLCVREWLQPGRRSVFSMFHTFVIVLVFAGGAAMVVSRLPTDVYEGTNTKYTCTALLAWIAVISLCLKQVAPYVSLPRGFRNAGWAAALAAVALALLPGHFREIAVWKSWTRHLWNSETALIAGVYDETLMRTLYWQPEVLYRILQQEFRPRRWSVFHTYPFQIGDPLTACYTVDSSHRGVGKIELTEPRSAAGKTVGAELAGWAWDEQGRRPFQDILLTDSQRRIVGIAHTTSDRADLALYFGDPQRLTCGWLGFVRTGVPAGLSAYGLIAGSRRVCPLIAP